MSTETVCSILPHHDPGSGMFNHPVKSIKA